MRAWSSCGVLIGGGLTLDQRFQQAFFGQTRPARGASVGRTAAQMLGDRAFLFGREFAVGMRREVVSNVLLAVHGSPCLYTQARII